MIYNNPQEFFVSVRGDKNNFKIIAVDVGLKKIGLAKYYSEIDVVLPMDVMANGKDVIEIVNKFDGVIIGNPITMKGEVSDNKEFLTKFVEKIKKPVFLVDERLSSKLADKMLKETGMKRKQRNQVDDSVVACIVLNDFLTIMKN